MSKTAEARRTAREMALDLGLDEIGAEQVAIVATEACTNLLKHAGRGQIVLQTAAEEASSTPFLELLAVDQGPGMRNLDACLQDGYSTASSAGQGLGAIQRMSKQSDIYTVPGKGTAVLARWWPGRNGWKPEAGELRLGAINVPKSGERVCGDAWGSISHDDSFVILVADGLGHGVEAQMASMEAVRQLQANPDLPPRLLLLRVHQALRSTRGAAVAVAQIDRRRGNLVFCGLGNVAARIYSGAEPRQNLVSLSGTAGHSYERIHEFSYAWPDDGLLVLHSDGLTTGTTIQGYPGLASRDPALIAGVLYRDFNRGTDDATVVIAKAA